MKDRTWLYISLLTLLVAILWIGVSVHSTLRKTTITPDVAEVITPLDPNLDMTVIDSLSQRGR